MPAGRRAPIPAANAPGGAPGPHPYFFHRFSGTGGGGFAVV